MRGQDPDTRARVNHGRTTPTWARHGDLQRAALDAYLEEVVRRSFPILPLAAATWHGHERARLERLGRPAPYVDGQIAAIAHAHGLVLVSANTADFSRFNGIKVRDWSRSARQRQDRGVVIP